MVMEKGVFCEDGCGGFQVKYGKFGYLYISWLDSCWYREQTRIPLIDRIKYLFGNRTVREIYVGKETLTDFLAFLKEAPELESDETSNWAELYFRFGFSRDALDNTYIIILHGNLSKKDILRGGYFRMFDLELNEEQKEYLIRNIEAVLKA